MLELTRLTTLGVEDLWAFTLLATAYGLYRMIVSRTVLKAIAAVLKVKCQDKFIHRAFDSVHYAASALLGTWALMSRPYAKCVIWAYECQDFLAPEPESFVCTRLEKIYYMIFLAYYVVGLFFLGTESDKWAMMFHHFVTISMIMFAVELRVPVIGLVVMLLHDLVDVPLYLGKILSYLGMEFGKNVSLLSFAALCTWLRMVNYPIVVYLVWANVPRVQFRLTLYKITASILIVLIGLHIYWEIKIVRAFIGMFGKEGMDSVRDNRSD
jgi:hypothetical protein